MGFPEDMSKCMTNSNTLYEIYKMPCVGHNAAINDLSAGKEYDPVISRHVDNTWSLYYVPNAGLC